MFLGARQQAALGAERLFVFPDPVLDEPAGGDLPSAGQHLRTRRVLPQRQRPGPIERPGVTVGPVGVDAKLQDSQWETEARQKLVLGELGVEKVSKRPRRSQVPCGEELAAPCGGRLVEAVEEFLAESRPL